jgi:hypothetical protein
VAEQAESGISVDQLAIFLGLGGDWQTRAGVT